MSDGISSDEAARILGVTKQTLYAYVSRGLVSVLPGGEGRGSLYPRDIVEELARSRRAGRRPKEIARKTIDWGLPVLETKISSIENERLLYRGVDAVLFSETATLEDAASLLWGVENRIAFPGQEGSALPPDPVAAEIAERDLLTRFALLSDDEGTAIWDAGARQAEGCGKLLLRLAACVTHVGNDFGPVHQRCARAWSLDDEEADILRQALVLCAEHELNVSSFTARCIASSGASIRAAVIGGLAALSGGKHGGMTLRVENMWSVIADAGTVAAGVRNLLAGHSDLPGFGHPLYPHGDVRAKALLDRIAPRLPVAAEIVSTIGGQAGRRPSLDFALVALRRALRLPAGSAFDIFALGRTVGWIAQAMEQRESQTLIRPRAVYVGAAHPEAG